MKTRNVLTALTAALLLSTSVFSQHSISGKVTSTEGEKLYGATVFLEYPKIGSSTDEEGKFKISPVPNGTYTLKVRLYGYREESVNVNVLNNNVMVDFRMSPTYFLKEGIDVLGVRATEKTPTTYMNIDRETIDKQNFGQDLPYLLESTPGTVVTSDAGAGVGYTGVRIRGVDPTRTNVTVNGIPLNDSESHGVFWVNMPDFASSVEDMQVQRGVGTSSNGGAAFGASININSNQVNKEAYGESDNSYGSFNTLKTTVRAGSGLINNRFTMDTRLSKITSDGYIDRARSNLRAFYVSGAYHGAKTSVKANVFGGHEETYQAWYGTPESVINGTEADRIAYAERNWLSEDQTENLLNSGRTYNFYTYENEVDNYQQTHYQLLFNHQFNENWKANVSAHYTRGQGYYEQYRANDRFSTYGFDPYTFGGSEVTFSDSLLVIDQDTLINPNPGVDTTFIVGEQTISRTDLIRRRWLDNHFYGGVFFVNYNNQKNLDLTFGGGANAYDGDHFGEVIWAQQLPEHEIRDRYYDNNGFKTDAHLYLKGTYDYNKFIFFGDLQYRAIDYTFLGVDEVDNELVELTQNANYNFINPKAGVTYLMNPNSNIYASYAVANREPVRRDFRESTPANRPLHETLFNFELGYRYKNENTFLNANFYHMEYDNQLVLTGQINDVGGYTRTNVKDSYRMGIELQGGYTILENLMIAGNFALSSNRIERFTEFVDNYDIGGQTEIVHENTDLAFSPAMIGGLDIQYSPIENLSIVLMNKYVGRQFLDNTSNPDRQLNGYFFANLIINYTIKTSLFKELTLGLRVNNLGNALYENNGYTWGYIAGGEHIQENFYYPQAGRHFLARLAIRF